MALVDRLQRKHQAALDTLVAQYGDELYGYIYQSIQDHQLSQALLGATFARVVELIDRYTADLSFIAWLYRITHTVMRDTYSATAHTSGAQQRSAATTPGHSHDAMRSLPLEQRQVIMLRCVADLSLNEIGYVLAKSNSAVKQLQYQALRALGESAAPSM